MGLPSAQLEIAPAFQALKVQIRRAVGDSAYDAWFADLSVTAWDGSVMVLAATTATDRFLSDRYGRTLQRCGEAVFGPNVTVVFKGDLVLSAKRALESASADHVDPLLRDQPFVPRYTFDQFIIGRGNRLAHAAALTVAESPGVAYNPLFLHAPPGLGKTHLLHAIGNYITAFDSSKTVKYTTVEAFTNGFLGALHGRDLDRFKALYRKVDVLLIDDVQFLENKVKTEEEFFHTFNALYGSGRQLVLTCDRLPKQLKNIEERLRERLESGLVATIEPPDYNTRLAILGKRVQLDSLTVSDPAVLEMIADRITGNVRQLQGALIRIVAHHSLTGQPLDLRLANEVLDEICPVIAKVPDGIEQANEIIRLVAQHFQLTIDDLRSASRVGRISWARQLAIHFCRERTDLSLAEIGERFGGRNHATVLHACKRVQGQITVNSEARDDVETMAKLLAAH